MTDAPLRILRLCDARPGHEKQSLGFVQGLKAHLPVACRNVQLYDRPGGALDRAALKHASDTSRADPPDLIVGAGHRTHLPMLWLRARRGGRTVVLMKPTLPIGLFDLVLIPEHDAAPAGLNVLTTQGVLSPIVDPSRIETDDTDVPAAGLILVGGINRHYAWHSRRVARQIGQVLRAAPQLAWQVSDSRRTPEDFPRALAEESEVPLRHWRDTGPDWLPRQLALVRDTWVTADSASMLYEALAAGSRVGIIELPTLRAGGKLQRGIERLDARGVIARSTETASLGATEPSATPPMQESLRCAREALTRFYPERL